MTDGQKRAIEELERLQAVNPDGFEIIGTPQIINGQLNVTISILLGLMDVRPEGLDFREREEFILKVPPDFPFEYPRLEVEHIRFAGFPHVNWSKHICLYQSKIEWNPSDGLYGYFDRLNLWLGRAAKGDMDPAEGPLHPPVYIPDWSLPRFVIRKNIPVKAGEFWIGLAELEKHDHRIELVGWNDLSGEWPKQYRPALAIVLPKTLPPEFPQNGKDFFAELAKQDIDKETVLRYLKGAAILTPEGEPAYLVLALPMRRSPNGETRHNITVWAIDSDQVKSFRLTLSSDEDGFIVKFIKEGIAELLFKTFELAPIKWCPVYEDRSEIVVRRDSNTPMAWFAGKKVLILGCGALGSWSAEIIARANPSLIHLLDDTAVKPGLLARQNFKLSDIGYSKASALKNRIQSIVRGMDVEYLIREAHSYIMEDLNRFKNYDLVLDCTASHIFQMKLEKDWNKFSGQTPSIISMVIDGKAKHCLCTIVPSNSVGGIWNNFIQLKYRLCFDSEKQELVTAFYSEAAIKDLFQPEPGCSDPTFSGSMADVASLAATALNLAVPYCADKDSVGIAFSKHRSTIGSEKVNIIKFSGYQEIAVGGYQIQILRNVYSEAAAWVKQNSRIRSSRHETGGLLWGLWDNSVRKIWVFDISGPPSDSIHDPARFVCGIKGTVEEHRQRFKLSQGVCGFIGFWHTHPDMSSEQSTTDISGMVNLVSQIGENQKRALMLILGRTEQIPSAGIYVYESRSIGKDIEMLSVGDVQIPLEKKVV